MMRFPITDLLSDDECYSYLVRTLHGPDGLTCPEDHALPDGQAPHDPSRAPIVKYRCHECGAVFVFTGTVWSGTDYDATNRRACWCFAASKQGVSTSQLADELGLDYTGALGTTPPGASAGGEGKSRGVSTCKQQRRFERRRPRSR